MKAITEERLRQIRSNFSDAKLMRDQVMILAIDRLIDECQEIDQLTVTKLRPMSEAPEKEYILVKTISSDSLIEAIVDKANKRIETKYGSERSFAHCDGWIPMPIFRRSE